MWQIYQGKAVWRSFLKKRPSIGAGLTISMLIRGMKSHQIREGKKEDIPQVLELVKELAEYERAAHEVTNTVEKMIADGFGERPVYGLFVAEMDGRIVGIALHYVRYSTWKGSMLYLEDIVVQEAMRGRGIGDLLFRECLKLAEQKNYAGVVWQVLDWNEPAIHFYKKYDAHLDPEWVNGKLLLDQIKVLNQRN